MKVSLCFSVAAKSWKRCAVIKYLGTVRNQPTNRFDLPRSETLRARFRDKALTSPSKQQDYAAEDGMLRSGMTFSANSS